MEIIYIGLGMRIGIIISIIYHLLKKAASNREIIQANELAKKIIEDANQEDITQKKEAV